MRKLLLAMAAMAAPAVAQRSDEVSTPPTAPRLQLVYFTREETAFLDTGSVGQLGDTIWGWGLNVHRAPFALAPGRYAAANWTRFRIDCARQTVTLLWGVARQDGATLFTVPLTGTFPITRGSGWDSTYVFGCRGRRDLFGDHAPQGERDAIAQARAEMPTAR